MIDLEEFERIKQLKYRYLRALDTNDWNLMRDCLTADCTARYDSGKYSYDGRDAILEFFTTFMSPSHILTLHQAHHPEIDLTDETHATGTWYLQDIVISTQDNFALRGAGFYHDNYVKIEGEWKINQTGYDRTYEETEERSDKLQITNNMFTQDQDS